MSFLRSSACRNVDSVAKNPSAFINSVWARTADPSCALRHAPDNLVASLFGTLGAYALYEILKAVYEELTSPVRSLPGPRSSHWFYGNLKEIFEDEDSGLEEHWLEKYGRTMKFHRFFGQAQLLTTDTKAIHHFLSNNHIYEKSEATRIGLGRVVGPGILVVEGDVHKQQNPAFGAPQVRELTSIFVDTSIQLRDIWVAQAAQNDGVARVEVLSWLSKATLDIIGLAGFNYRINALGAESHDVPDPLAEAFDALFTSGTSFSLLRLFQSRVSVLRNIPTKQDKIMHAAQATMLRIGRQLLEESKREIAANGTFNTGRGRDLLTLLVRANTSKEIPADQRLSDEDVLAQVPTFLVAGHETSSTAVTWALFALTQNMAAQMRLREELLAVSTDTPTMDELNSLPYLECVVKETLRVHAPVTGTSRMAMRDDVVPLGTPVTDIHGTVHESLHIRKGQRILIPIISLNRDSAIWGPDAMEFIPERWEAGTPVSNTIPGVWGHMMTFLGGPRSCIGFRFSLVEIKALLFTLVRALEFELAVPIADMGKKGTAIVQRPIVLSDPAAGNQLPLLVRPVVR
ncbi:cytochrome P450 [Mycena rosella]|uniref:Cytochrome P450 n=1 Tax=Mycena rosella TaxID=1033263 RepID=A0AAD7DUL1_MYCRO|nr:cytochrome P450 [Mycena rosella]